MVTWYEYHTSVYSYKGHCFLVNLITVYTIVLVAIGPFGKTAVVTMAFISFRLPHVRKIYP